MDIQNNTTHRLTLAKVEIKEEEIDFDYSNCDISNELKSEIKKEQSDIIVHTGIVIDEDEGNNLMVPGRNSIQNNDIDNGNQYSRQGDFLYSQKTSQSDKEVSNIKKLKTNLKVHSVDLPQQSNNFVRNYQCHLCDKVFFEEHCLKGHLWMHKYKCKKCDKAFTQKNLFSHYMNSKCGKEIREKEEKEKKANENQSNPCDNNLISHTSSLVEENAFHCKLCPGTFKDPKSFMIHMTLQHKYESKRKKSRRKPKLGLLPNTPNAQPTLQLPQGPNTQETLQITHEQLLLRPQVPYTQPVLQFSQEQLLPHGLNNSQSTLQLPQDSQTLGPREINVQPTLQLPQRQLLLVQGLTAMPTSQLPQGQLGLHSHGLNTIPTSQLPQGQLGLLSQGLNTVPTSQLPQGQLLLSQGIDAQPMLQLPQDQLYLVQGTLTQPTLQMSHGQLLLGPFLQGSQGQFLPQGSNVQPISQVPQEK